MKDTYCGIGDVPKNKKRGSAKECYDMGQVRYYGIKKIDKETIKSSEASKSMKGRNLFDEQMEMKKIQQEGKALVKKYKEAKFIADHEKSTDAQKKKAKRDIDALLKKKDVLQKKFVKQKNIIDKLQKMKTTSMKPAKKTTSKKPAKKTTSKKPASKKPVQKTTSKKPAKKPVKKNTSKKPAKKATSKKPAKKATKKK